MEQENRNVAIKIEHLSKTYKVFSTPGKRLRYQLFGGKGGTDFKALDDVNVEIKRGEAFAVIGKNGSGKSTLLQLLAGIIKPSSGMMQINGRIAALLELGSGFDPESTGYENIYMNAAILGVEKSKIEEKIQDIIEFADIGEHLYQPVKTYSSGMYVRLGFAVAINVDADILLVDEALAVGDVFFRQKCYERLNELKRNGTTIILVTHNMGEVEQFCDRALLLHYGKTVCEGLSKDVVKKYYIINNQQKSVTVNPNVKCKREKYDGIDNHQVAFLNGWKIQEKVFFDLSESKEIANGKATFRKVGLFDESGNAKRTFEQGEKGYFYLEIELKESIEIPNVGVFLHDQMNILIHGKDMIQSSCNYENVAKNENIIYYMQTIEFDIAEGEYTFGIGLGSIRHEDFEQRKNLSQEELNSKIEHICDRNRVGSFSVVQKKIGMPTRMGFYGVADLTGTCEVILR